MNVYECGLVHCIQIEMQVCECACVHCVQKCVHKCTVHRCGCVRVEVHMGEYTNVYLSGECVDAICGMIQPFHSNTLKASLVLEYQGKQAHF